MASTPSTRRQLDAWRCVHPTHFLVCAQATLIFKVELVGIKDRTKGSGESDRERLAALRAEREAAAAEAKAKKEAAKAAGADKQNALKEKLANKGKKGKGGGKKAWAPKAPKEKKSPKAKTKKTPA